MLISSARGSEAGEAELCHNWKQIVPTKTLQMRWRHTFTSDDTFTISLALEVTDCAYAHTCIQFISTVFCGSYTLHLDGSSLWPTICWKLRRHLRLWLLIDYNIIRYYLESYPQSRWHFGTQDSLILYAAHEHQRPMSDSVPEKQSQYLLRQSSPQPFLAASSGFLQLQVVAS